MVRDGGIVINFIKQIHEKDVANFLTKKFEKDKIVKIICIINCNKSNNAYKKLLFILLDSINIFC